MFRKVLQFINGTTNSMIIHNGTKIKTIMKYVVLTNDFPLFQSPKAIDSANLFFNPRVKPMSKKLSQTIIEESINQMPYSSEFTYPKVIGTSIKDIKILNPFTAKEPRIFFLL